MSVEFALPQIGEGVYEAELVRWLVQPGSSIRRGQGLLEVLTDKATMEVPAAFAGIVTELRAEPGHRIKVGEVILTYEASESFSEVLVPQEVAAVAEAVPVPASPPRPTNGTAHRPIPPLPVAAPSIRHLARKMGIDLTKVRGTGPAGRILLEDLSSFLGHGKSDGKSASRTISLPELGQPGTRIPLVGLRRQSADHLLKAKRTIPEYSYIDECDLTELVRLRANLRETFARQGVKLTYLAFFVKAAVAALREVPLVNAVLDESKSEIVLHDRYNIGIAVSTPTGLIVPVVKDADRKDIAHIASEIERLSQDARVGKSKLDDLRGGTFTITSIGNIGGLISTPIINHPEVGIVGVGKVVKRPVYDAAGQIRPADLVYLSFTFDHRVVDGAVGATFGNAFVKCLQNPAVLLLPERFQ